MGSVPQWEVYRCIRDRCKKDSCTSTDTNIEAARVVIAAYTGSDEMNKTIWKSIRKCTTHLQVQQFLFKAIHNTPMVGEVWLNIEGFQQRGSCTPCGTIENMSHILLSCAVGLVEIIWNMTKRLWPYNNTQWLDINLGTIFGCGCLMTKEENGSNRNTRGEGSTLKQRGKM